MTLKKSLVATLLSTVMCTPALAQESFNKGFYFGLGSGASNLAPEKTAGVADIEVADEEDSGSKFFLGYDLSPRAAVELTGGKLGAATISGTTPGEISYDVVELSGLYHFFNLGGYDNMYDRRGLGAFVKAGLGFMENDANTALLDERWERKNDVHLMGGIGVEFATSIGLAVRAEYETFDKDAQLASLSLLYRLGGKRGSGGMMKKSDGGLFSKDGAVGGMLSGVTAAGDDDDADGVPNSLDDCAGTLAGEPVTATGCAMFGGALEGVQFASGSDKLLDEAQMVLNDAADVLLQNPNIKVEVQAHTDSQGAAEYNIELSKKRALATVRYLMLRGVPAEQMTARAFGESKPIADNDTPDGRNTNRRVEFHVIER